MNNSPLRYPGGKHKLFKFVRQQIIENGCTVYIEPFCGGAAVALELLRTGIVERIILNDFDRSIYCLWKVILEAPDDLIKRIEETPVTIEEWRRQKDVRTDLEGLSDLDVAFSTLFLNRTNRSGIIDKAGPIGGKDQAGKYKLDCRFKKDKLIKKIRLIHSMKDRIQIFNLESRQFLNEVILPEKNSFTFFDPPYFQKGRELYSDYLNEKGHQELSQKIIQELKDYKWIVTYDNAPEIREMYSEVSCKEYILQYTLQTKVKATELMVFSPALKQPIKSVDLTFICV